MTCPDNVMRAHEKALRRTGEIPGPDGAATLLGVQPNTLGTGCANG